MDVPGGDPAHDVCRADLRPSAGGRQGSRHFPEEDQKCRGRPQGAVA